MSITHNKPTLAQMGIELPPEDSKFSILLEGPPKQGKTHFATTMPDPTFLVADQNYKAHESHGVRFFVIDNWVEWEQRFRPAITQRIFPGDTIVLDTVSALFRKLERHLAKNNLALEGYQEWNHFRGNAIKLADDLNAARKPEGDHPGYNICVLTHQKTETDTGGNVIGYLPDISSKLDRSFAGLFDAHFCTSVETENDLVRDSKGSPTGETVQTSKYFIHSTPPTSRHNAGDNLGGDGKKYSKLPPKLGNTFPELLKEWGVSDSEPSK